jgi:uncharacterized repeat protein (TIGR01451 family)
METERNIWLSWRRFAAPFLALILTGLLLAAWLSIVSAHELKSSAPISQGNSLSNSKKVAPGPIGFRADQNGPISTTMLAPLAEYDLEIQKSQSPQEFTVGGDNTYIVYITRLNSEAVPSGFSVEDTLPDGMSLTPTATIGNWDCSASTVQKLTCFYTKNITGTALIDPLQFNVNVDPNISDSVTNTAQLYFDGAAKFSMVVTPISKVDLVLSKIQTPVVVQSLNTLISYTLTITNHGLAIADNVIVTETLPAELQPYTTTNLIPSVNPSKGSFNPETNIWTIGNMNQGEVQRLVLLTRPKTIVYGKSITNLARASSDNRDWNPGDNIASSSFVVGGVEISKSFYPNHIILYTGDIFTFTIAMTNASSSPVSNVLVQDVLTDTLDFVDCKIIYSSTPPMPPNCEITNRNLNTYLNFTSGQRAWVVIRVRGNEGTGATPFTFKNHASVTWGSPSFTLNSNEVEGAIFPTGSLQVRKTDQAIQVKRSQLVSYTISI